MAIDTSIFARSIRRRGDLLGRLGDVGHFLGDLMAGREFSPASVTKKIAELEVYLAGVLEKIEEIGHQWQRSDQQLAEIHQRLKTASRAEKSMLAAQAQILLDRGDGFQGSIGAWRSNGQKAQILASRLRDLVILLSQPMSEDAIDQWTDRLGDAIQSDRTIREALDGLTKVAECSRAVAEPDPVQDIEARLRCVLADPSEHESPAAAAEPAGQDQARPRPEDSVEKKLNELFEEM